VPTGSPVLAVSLADFTPRPSSSYADSFGSNPAGYSSGCPRFRNWARAVHLQRRVRRVKSRSWTSIR